ncbi:Os12g0275500 [Oryza sativa Japonica Group]|uniref:Os12g0275500 protein n=2 Tax=Oryza sativa subsp. japonica TaxID=39947 RepID=A0A0P0Y901_ORYSJ|nr:hypothetical protein EE612_058862 [Oryza sativa]BAT16671.1 Os12g0275500 [Oryza sativa Japonica Group]
MAVATDDDEDVEEMQGYRIGRIGSASCKEDRLDQMGSAAGTRRLCTSANNAAVSLPPGWGRSRSIAFGGRQRRTAGPATGTGRASQVFVDGDGGLRHSCSIPFVHVRPAGTVPVLGEAHGVIWCRKSQLCAAAHRRRP